MLGDASSVEWAPHTVRGRSRRPDRSGPSALRGPIRPNFEVVSRGAMLVAANQALGQTLALLATFIGIGVLVNVLIVYIVAVVLAERKQNQEANQRTQ